MQKAEALSWWSVAWRAGRAAERTDLPGPWVLYFERLCGRALGLAMGDNDRVIDTRQVVPEATGAKRLARMLCKQDLTHTEITAQGLGRALLELRDEGHVVERGGLWRLTSAGKRAAGAAGFVVAHRPEKPGPRAADAEDEDAEPIEAPKVRQVSCPQSWRPGIPETTGSVRCPACGRSFRPRPSWTGNEVLLPTHNPKATR